MSNVSARHFFRTELAQLEEWCCQTRERTSVMACLRYGRKNLPHLLIGSGCQSLFLLDHVRAKEGKSHLVPRLLFAWMLVTGMLFLSVGLSFKLKGTALFLVVVGLVALTGLVLKLVFRSVET